MIALTDLDTVAPGSMSGLKILLYHCNLEQVTLLVHFLHPGVKMGTWYIEMSWLCE